MATEQSPDLPAWPLAKIAPPRSRTLVSRPRLIEPLNAAARAGQVTLVVAPGGSGKTSLLVDWTHHAPIPVAWYGLDAADRDMHRLTSGICAAVDRVIPGTARRAYAVLNSGGSETAAIGLLLAALEGQPLALVIDDLQYLDDAPEAVLLWDHLFRFRPQSLSLFFLSRSVPLMGFAALAAMDSLLGLGREDLRFDAAEASELLTAHGLSGEAAAQFATRSGGWATGVLLLARAAPGGLRFLRARMDALMEQLGADMLHSLTDEVRSFLLESAAIGPVSANEANGILQRRDSEALFAEITASGLFLEQDGELYRYHDLFAEYLSSVLQTENPERLRDLRRAGAAWWVNHDDLPRALGLLAAGEDWEPLAALLDREGSVLSARGLWGTALAHVEQLPAPYRTSKLLALCGHARSERGEYTAALAFADAGMAAAENEEDWLSPAFLRTHALVQGSRYEEAVRSAEATLVVAKKCGHDRAVTRLHELRGIARVRLGRLDAGRSDLLTALADFEALENEEGEARTLFNLATQLVEAGYAADAAEYLSRAALLYRKVNNKALLGQIHNTWALLHASSGNYAAARADAEQAIKVAQAVGYPILECIASATLAEVCADDGDLVSADLHATAAAELAERLDNGSALNDALRVRIAVALARRDRSGASLLINQARALVVTPVDAALLDYHEGVLALRSRAHSRAIDLLGQAAERLEAVSRPHAAARGYLLRAEALLLTGSLRRAEETLNHVAELVLPLGCEGYLHPSARLARQVLAERRTLRRLRREARLLLDRLAATVPTLAVLTQSGTEETGLPVMHISPFGHGRIVLGSRELEISTLPPKARELLFYTAHRGNKVSRAELLEIIWNDDSRGPQSLWDATRHLRRVLGERSWSTSNGAYLISLLIQHDGHDFSQLATEACGQEPALVRLTAAERALTLLGAGGYLEWCDSLWAMTERERVTRQATAVALAAASLYEAHSRFGDAITVCRQAIGFDPLNEEPRRRLLEALAATGQIAEAIEEFSAFSRLLREELRTRPSPELRTFAANLGRNR